MASASSLHYLSLTPQSLSLSKTNTIAATPFPFLSFPYSSSLKLSLSTSSLSSSSFSARQFIRNVAVSSEFDQIEETEEEEEDDNGFDSAQEQSFSPDLKLFVGNLPFNVDSAILAGLFERAGNVEMVEVIYDKVTGRSRGFGFVTMSTVEEVEAAAQQFNGYELEGRALRVNSGPAPPRRERERENSSFRGGRGGGGGGGSMSFDNSNRVYVGNLSWGVDDHALETLFREQGRVVEAKVIYDRDSGRSRGFGFVTYSSADEVNSAIEALDGIDLDGRSIRVSPAEARPRRQF